MRHLDDRTFGQQILNRLSYYHILVLLHNAEKSMHKCFKFNNQWYYGIVVIRMKICNPALSGNSRFLVMATRFKPVGYTVGLCHSNNSCSLVFECQNASNCK